MNKIELKEDERIDQLYANDIKIIQKFKSFFLFLWMQCYWLILPSQLKKKWQGSRSLRGQWSSWSILTSKTKASIATVEIQPKLAEMAKRSVKLNSFRTTGDRFES